MRKLITVLVFAMLSLGVSAQKISTMVDAGDSLTALTNKDYISLSRIGTVDTTWVFQAGLLTEDADTASMLSTYAKLSEAVLPADTASMLSTYAKLSEAVLPADTASMLSTYAKLSEAVLPADTASMLSTYAKLSEAVLPADTASMLSTYAKLSEAILPADTAAMLNAYAPNASPSITGTATLPIVNVGGAANFALPISIDSTVSMGEFGDATQTILSESSSNTNVLLGVYPMLNYEATAWKVFAGTHNRLLLITTKQDSVTTVGAEDQFRVKGVNLGRGVHAGLWAYAEQSGTTVLSDAGTFDAINATVESASTFTVGATEQVTGITLDCSLDGSASVDADANFSGIYIKSNGLDWKTGIKFEGIDSAEMVLVGGAIINNIRSADTLEITETAVSIHGALHVTGNMTTDGTFPSDFAITDYQPPLLDYWAKTQELNKLPAFENRSRNNVMEYISGLEESNERLLRYVVEMEARLAGLEAKLND